MQLKEVLLKEIKRRGITKIFGVPGRENASILFNEIDGIEFITTRIEFTAGIMADFTGRLLNQPQICFCTMGPGATNMTTALASAMLNHSPMILISAQLEDTDRHYNTTHQCVDQKTIFEPITKWSIEIENPNEFPQIIERAFDLVMEEPLGPVHISIPTNFFTDEIDVNYNIDAPLISKINYSVKKGISLDELEKCINLIDISEYPICLVGQEVIRSGAEEMIARFCHKFNIPLISAANAKGILANKDPLNVGSVSCYMEGILGRPGLLDEIFSCVDLIINIGYQYTDDILPKMWIRGIPKKVIDISAVGDNIALNYVCEHKLIGDISETVNEFLDRKINPKKIRDFSYLKDVYNGLLDQKHTGNQLLNPIQVVSCINAHLKDGLFITDIGYYRHHAVIFSCLDKTSQFFTDSGLSSFGSGLPSSAAAQLAYPDKNVFLLCGDGGFHSGSGDLETLVRYSLPVVIILLNNSSYKLIHLYQKRGKLGENAEMVSFNKVDFVKLAEANGCKGLRAETLEHLNHAIATRDRKKPLLIEVPFDYGECDVFTISF
jgi:N2-(2-carboxyethyl)arginine synthase